MLRLKNVLPLLPEFTKSKNVHLISRSVSNRHASRIDRPKLLADNQFSRKQYLAARVWDDNAEGKLNERTLPYYLNKIEKLALTSLEEKKVALKESSSFLAAMIIDKEGVMKKNYYSEGLKMKLFKNVSEMFWNS